ncbi:MAG: PH domain-containing protein [Chloroflexi bacterium]|nr:PH domain-containing protein [Chloroflexota bacterium]MCY3938748.1 PH domain-containing protein [Chloroflexota bacterium]
MDDRVSIIREAAKDFGILQRNQVRAEMKELPSILGEMELLEKLVPCNNSYGMGLLAATNQRLVYLNKLPLGKTHVEQYNYGDITSIEFKTTKLIRGVLRFSVLGERMMFGNLPTKLTSAFAEHLRSKVPPENLENASPAPSPEQAEAIHAAVQEISPSNRDGIKKELDELPAILSDDELPEKMIEGWYGGGTGLLVATNKRLFFTDKRRFTGLQVEDFLYETINSVSARTGMILGSIRIHTAGNIEVIDNVENELVHPFAEFVRNKISAANSRANVAAPATSSLADELKKLAELVDMGILTKEEFEQQKAKLLGS